ncbi:MAG TPA: isocitrate/isopropylmalate family dehydrogenase [Terriglobales bacterium]|nr:isocitrate/isopropylmalate family dehydrogenase [Terriglobales bacterium]
MMKKQLKITVLPGDGIGPEVTREAVRALRIAGEYAGLSFEFQEHAIGGRAVEQFGTPLPRATLDACLASDAVLLGAVGGPQWDARPRAQKLKPACCSSALRSAGSPTCVPRCACRRWRSVRRCARKLSPAPM